MDVPVPFQFPDAMLLSAGLGTRLRPLTLSVPKPLVRVGGIALVDRVFDAARREGARRFVVNVHHHAEQMFSHIETLRAQGVDIAVSDERDGLRDTGGALRKALPLLGGDPILVMNTDAFWIGGSDRPIGRMLVRMTPATEIVLLCVQPRRASGFRRSHDFCLDPRGTVTTDTGAPVIYAGVALIRRGLPAAETDDKFSLNRLFEAALNRGTLGGVVLDAPWLHVGDAEALREAEAELKAQLP